MARRLAPVLISVIVGANVVLCGVGYFVFNQAASGPLAKADAIVVLGGEHDGREEYGISLAQRGLASAVVLSDPYGRDDKLMQRLCAARYAKVEVICYQPHLTTTRGEAMMARELVAQRQWQKLIVVTWRFHIPGRATSSISVCRRPPGCPTSRFLGSTNTPWRCGNFSTCTSTPHLRKQPWYQPVPKFTTADHDERGGCCSSWRLRSASAKCLAAEPGRSKV